MNPTVAAFLRSWTWAPWTIAALRGHVRTLLPWLAEAVTEAKFALVSARACRVRRRIAGPALCGMLAVGCLRWIAPFGAHGAAHRADVRRAAAVVVECPQLPLMHGLPREVLRYWVLPLLRSTVLRTAFRGLAHPAVAWTLSTVMLLAWHLPVLYQLALDSEFWHVVEHASFLGSALLFWWPVIQPWPSRAVWPRPAIMGYVLVRGSCRRRCCAVSDVRRSRALSARDAVPRCGHLGTDGPGRGRCDDVGDRDGGLPGTARAHWRPFALPAPRVGDPGHHESQKPYTAGRHFDFEGAVDRLRSVARATPGAGAEMALHAACSLQFVPFLLLAGARRHGRIEWAGPGGPLNLAGVLPWTHWRAGL